jgi:prepilin-type N-terminal cleavage/methylation domain-containing protein
MEKTHKPGFTLVELLVVIGIIALIISMLLPALGKARQQSNQVVCESNLRQIGVAMLIYADEHDGFLFPDKMGWDAQHVYPWPPTDLSTGAGLPNTPTGTWPTLIFSQWNPPVMLCPSDQQPVGQHSYLINEHMAYWNVKYSSNLPAGTSPSNVVLMGEKATTAGDYYMEYGDFATGKVEEHRHGFTLGSNYLMLDMSVQLQLPLTLQQQEMALDPWDFSIGTPPPTTQSSN